MNQQLNAGVAELADAPDLGSGTVWCEGSSPFSRTISSHIFDQKLLASIS